MKKERGELDPRWYAYYRCHRAFSEAIKSGKCKEEKEILSLHLYAFLASWGMATRRAFLLSQNYTVLQDVVEIAGKKEYSFLLNISPYDSGFDRGEYCRAVLELRRQIRKNLEEKGSGVSDTLISKILLGIFGCVIGYDSKVRTKLLEKGVSTSFSERGLISLCGYFQTARKEILAHREVMCKECNWDVPVMEAADHFLWS